MFLVYQCGGEGYSVTELNNLSLPSPGAEQQFQQELRKQLVY